MRKLLLLLAIISIGEISQAQNAHGKNVETSDTSRWVRKVETSFSYWRRFGEEPLNKIKVSTNYLHPAKLSPNVPIIASADYGYINEHTALLGIGGAFGNKHVYFSPQAFIAVGYQDGLGLGWMFDVEKGMLLFHNKTAYITDYRSANDAVFSLTEITCRPTHYFGFGAEFLANIDLDRKKEDMFYKTKSKVGVETSAFIRIYPNFHGFFLTFSGGIEPTSVKKNSWDNSWYLMLTSGWNFSWPTKKK